MEYQKTLKPKITRKIIPPDFAESNGGWLVENTAELLESDKIGYVLIHADDGVLWGRIEDGRLVTPSRDEWVPELRSKTVQQCRVFGSKGELFIWRESEGIWNGRLLIEDGTAYRSKERRAILYGSRIDSHPAPQGFVSVIELGVGMRQIVPVEVPPEALKDDERDFKEDWRVALTVVEYSSEDDDGQVMIVCSRLKAVNVRRV